MAFQFSFYRLVTSLPSWHCQYLCQYSDCCCSSRNHQFTFFTEKTWSPRYQSICRQFIFLFISHFPDIFRVHNSSCEQLTLISRCSCSSALSLGFIWIVCLGKWHTNWHVCMCAVAVACPIDVAILRGKWLNEKPWQHGLFLFLNQMLLYSNAAILTTFGQAQARTCISVVSWSLFLTTSVKLLDMKYLFSSLQRILCYAVVCRSFR